MNLEEVISPAEAVDILCTKGVRISERTLRERARKIGAYRQLGQAIFFLPEDLDKIMEPEECLSPSNGRKARTTSQGEPSMVPGLKKAQEKRRLQPQNGPANGSSPKSSQVIPIPFRREK